MPRELIRRILLLGGVLQAIWLFLYAPLGIIDIQAIDWQREYERYYEKPAIRGSMGAAKALIQQHEGRLTLDQFIAKKTADRVIEVSGEDWRRFFGRIWADAPPPAEGYTPRTYHSLREEPLASIGSQFGKSSSFHYLRLREAGGERFLGATHRYPSEASRMGAAAEIVYPYRHWSWWIALGGIACYIGIPWMKRIPGAIRFGRASGVVVPDIMGLLLTCLFYTLPLLIVPSFCQCTSAEIFEEGIAFFLLFTPFCLGGVAILLYAAHYASFQIIILPHGLRRMTPGHAEDFEFAQIASIQPVDQRTPKWLVVLGTLLIFVSWRAIVPANTLRNYRRRGIDILRKDGAKLRIWSDIPGFERIEEALAKAGWPAVLETTEA